MPLHSHTRQALLSKSCEMTVYTLWSEGISDFTSQSTDRTTSHLEGLVRQEAYFSDSSVADFNMNSAGRVTLLTVGDLLFQTVHWPYVLGRDQNYENHGQLVLSQTCQDRVEDTHMKDPIWWHYLSLPGPNWLSSQSASRPYARKNNSSALEESGNSGWSARWSFLHHPHQIGPTRILLVSSMVRSVTVRGVWSSTFILWG